MNESIRMHFGKELLRYADSYDFMVFNADTKSCGIENFGDKYPERNYTFGIAEQNLMAAASGAAMCGEKVVLATFAVFASMRACEQIRTFICLPRLDVMILASHGGLQTGADGASHIAVEDVSILRSIPNITIVEPSDSVAAEKLVEEALKFHGPLYIRFPKAPTPVIHDEDYRMIIGKAVEHSNGNDVTLIATGWMLSRVLAAAAQLRERNISVAVLEVHTIKPLDEDAVLAAAKKTGALVTVEDNSIFGGLGGAVSELVSSAYPVPVKHIGILDRFGESGTAEQLYKDNKMTVEDIVEAAMSAISMKRS